MSAWRPTDDVLYHAFVNPKESRAKVAALSLDSATRMVEYRRKKKASREYRDLPMSDQAIAQAILNYARGVAATVACPACNAPNPWANSFCGKCGASLESAKVIPEREARSAERPMSTEKPQKRSTGREWMIVGGVLAGGIVLLCIVFAVVSQLTAPDDTERTAIAATVAAAPTRTPKPTNTTRPTDTPLPPTDTPSPTDTPLPTKTSPPTDTPLPPTDTPSPTDTPPPTNTPPPTATPNPDLLRPGTYIVGTDIQPGIYKGEGGHNLADSCYWARLKDVSGSMDALIANDNSIGQFYVEVTDSDYAFETHCEVVLLRSLPEPPTEFPQRIAPGMYIVGVDIQPGKYRGQAGTEIFDSCYWARLKDVLGEVGSIIANDNATGQYYVQVQQGDFALQTRCELERIGD
jgi:hypothetical protein